MFVAQSVLYYTQNVLLNEKEKSVSQFMQVEFSVCEERDSR